MFDHIRYREFRDSSGLYYDALTLDCIKESVELAGGELGSFESIPFYRIPVFDKGKSGLVTYINWYRPNEQETEG